MKKWVSFPIQKVSRIPKRERTASTGRAAPGKVPAEFLEPSAAFLAPGVECKGVMVGDGPLRIDGTMEGEIHSSSAVIVGKQGAVDAKIRAESVMTNGEISGDVEANKHIYMQSSAVMRGTVSTPHLSMEEGAVLETEWSLWINGARIPGNLWLQHFQQGVMTNPPWWPQDVKGPEVRKDVRFG